MKAVIYGFVFGFVFLIVFLAGFGFGLEVRFMSRPVPSDRRELKCTCVPCLPDLFCLKCGHKSRDCPKLASYFQKGTNAVNAASAPAK